MGVLDGRIALVTGASRGIGLASARALVGAGARVALLARGRESLAEAVAVVGASAFSVRCDVSDNAALYDAVEQIRATVGEPDILVNNAGRFLVAPADETSPDDFASVVSTNLVAPFAIVRALLPTMRKAGRGHIVTIGSIADRHIFPGNAAYSASKYGLRALHEVLHAELRGSGVRTTLVSPGPVDTPLWDAIDPDNSPGFTPRSAMLQADAVAAAVLYAVSAPEGVNIDELRLSRR
ncbi:MAG: SDR family oxidoreductase [Gemmatimonadaceae bacterium]|nr:SDR family oxidoreductase [Gemmatimonadaceae bacterium]